MTNQERKEALVFAVGAIAEVHGSVVGNLPAMHYTEPTECYCSYGVAIRDLLHMRDRLYRKLRSEELAKAIVHDK